MALTLGACVDRYKQQCKRYVIILLTLWFPWEEQNFLSIEHTKKSHPLLVFGISFQLSGGGGGGGGGGGEGRGRGRGGKGMKGIKGREGKGREGKGRERKGREGKGREGKGREGKDSTYTTLGGIKCNSLRCFYFHWNS